MAKGDPHTRPDAEYVFVPSSHDIEQDAKDWESCTLVPWAMHLLEGDGARAIQELLMEQLLLQHRDVAVTVHQPEPYLIRFERKEHCAEARDQGRFTGRGIDICLRPWCSLTHALGMRIFFRVRLCLDGISSHVWTPDIVERVIGSRCALQCINTDLVEPKDTRHIDLWAWTADPSEIPKKVWLVFTHRPTERSSRIFISETPPDSWHQGARFPVFIHMPLVEDYSAAANDLQSTVDNPSSIKPIRRNYTWCYGIVDGSPPGTRAAFPARLPRPPPLQDGGEEREARRDDGRGVTRSAQMRNDSAGRNARHGDRRGAGSSSERHDAVRDMGHRDTRTKPRREQGNERRRTGRTSCKEQGFTWPHGRDEDGDDDYDHPGRGRDASLGFSFFSLNDSEPVHRERTRSPRRCDGAFWRHRPVHDDHAAHRTDERDDDDDIAPAAGERGRGHGSLQGDSGNQELSGLLAAHAYASKTTAAFLLNKVSSNTDASLQQMACRFAVRHERDGDATWSEAQVPAARVFGRINSLLRAPTVQEVEAALDALQFGENAYNKEGAAPEEDAGHHDRPPSSSTTTADDPDMLQSSLGGPGYDLGLVTPTGPAGPGLDGNTEATPTGPVGPGRDESAEQLSAAHSGPASDALAGPDDADGPEHVDGLVGADGPEQENDDDANNYGLEDLFCTPPPPIVNRPPARRPRQRRTFDMSAVRRSARLAKKPSKPAVERAQRNLCRKLGLTEEEAALLEEVLADFIAMYTGPLPEHIIAALTTIFGLEDEGAEMLNEALLEHAGEGVDDVLAEGGPALV
ncbi:unnamed protein product [Urochloa humidicola]